VKNTRPQWVGWGMGFAIIQMIHLMYQNNTAKGFLEALIEILEKELRKRNES